MEFDQTPFMSDICAVTLFCSLENLSLQYNLNWSLHLYALFMATSLPCCVYLVYSTTLPVGFTLRHCLAIKEAEQYPRPLSWQILHKTVPFVTIKSLYFRVLNSTNYSFVHQIMASLLQNVRKSRI